MLWQKASRYCWSAKSYEYFIIVMKWLILYFPNVPCILIAVSIFLLMYQTILALYMMKEWSTQYNTKSVKLNRFNLLGYNWKRQRVHRFHRSWLNLLQFSFLHFPEKTRAWWHLTRVTDVEESGDTTWEPLGYCVVVRLMLPNSTKADLQQLTDPLRRHHAHLAHAHMLMTVHTGMRGAYTVLSQIMEASTWLDFWLSPICWWGNLNYTQTSTNLK